MPADVRLNMLTGVLTNIPKSHSLTASNSTVDERSKDALVRIDELIRQNFAQGVGNKVDDSIINMNISLSSIHYDKRRQSNEISPMHFYANETNKLTTDLKNSMDQQNIMKQDITNLDDINKRQVSIFWLFTST